MVTYITRKLLSLLEPKAEVIRLLTPKLTRVSHITCFLEYTPGEQILFRVINIKLTQSSDTFLSLSDHPSANETLEDYRTLETWIKEQILGTSEHGQRG